MTRRITIEIDDAAAAPATVRLDADPSSAAAAIPAEDAGPPQPVDEAAPPAGAAGTAAADVGEFAAYSGTDAGPPPAHLFG